MRPIFTEEEVEIIKEAFASEGEICIEYDFREVKDDTVFPDLLASVNTGKYTLLERIKYTYSRFIRSIGIKGRD